MVCQDCQISTTATPLAAAVTPCVQNANHAQEADHSAVADLAHNAEVANGAHGVTDGNGASVQVNLNNGNLDGNGYFHVGGQGSETFRAKFGGSAVVGTTGNLDANRVRVNSNNGAKPIKRYHKTHTVNNIGANSGGKITVNLFGSDHAWYNNCTAIVSGLHMNTSSGNAIEDIILTAKTISNSSGTHVEVSYFRTNGALTNVEIVFSVVLIHNSLVELL